MPDPIIVRAPLFSPSNWSGTRRNFRRQIIVQRDGSFTERIMLAVSDARFREFLVCLHYLRSLGNTLGEELGINFI